MEQTIRRYRSDWDLTQCGQLENGIYRSCLASGAAARHGVSAAVLVCIRAGLCPGLCRGRSIPGSVYEMEPALERAASDLLLYGVKGLSIRFTVEPGEALISYDIAFPGLSH